jgi:hypothetical protein
VPAVVNRLDKYRHLQEKKAKLRIDFYRNLKKNEWEERLAFQNKIDSNFNI